MGLLGGLPQLSPKVNQVSIKFQGTEVLPQEHRVQLSAATSKHMDQMHTGSLAALEEHRGILNHVRLWDVSLR